MGIYKNGKEITAIYKNGKEVTAIYKSGNLIYSSRGPLWESGNFKYIAQNTQLSPTHNNLMSYFNIDVNAPSGHATGVQVTDGSGNATNFFATTGNFLGSQQISSDDNTIYAANSNNILYKLFTDPTGNQAIQKSAVLKSATSNTFYDSWGTNFKYNVDGSTATTSPFIITTKDGYIEIINLDKFSPDNALSNYELSGFNDSNGNPLIIIPYTNLFPFNEQKGMANMAKGGALILPSNTASGSGKIGYLSGHGEYLDISGGGSGGVTTGVSLSQSGSVSPKTMSTYVNNGIFSIIGYWSDSSNTHGIMVAPISSDGSFINKKSIDNNISLIDLNYNQGINLWSIYPEIRPEHFIKEELGQIDAISEDVNCGDNDMTSKMAGNDTAYVTYQKPTTKNYTYNYKIPNSGKIYASLYDSINNVSVVKKFSLDSSDANYWNPATSTSNVNGTLNNAGEVNSSSTDVVSPYIKIPASAKVINIDSKSNSGNPISAYAIYDKDNSKIIYNDTFSFNNIDNNKRLSIDVLPGYYYIRISCLSGNNLAVSFDNNVIYTTDKGYKVSHIIQDKHKLYLTINNRENGWGKYISNGYATLLSSQIDDEGTLYSVKSDNTSPYYTAVGKNTKDGSTNTITSQYSNSGYHNTLLYMNHMHYDSSNSRMLMNIGNSIYYVNKNDNATAPAIISTNIDYSGNNDPYTNSDFIVTSKGNIIIANVGGNNIVASYSSTGTLLYTAKLSSLSGIQGMIYDKSNEEIIVRDSFGAVAKLDANDLSIIFDISFNFKSNVANTASNINPNIASLLDNGNIMVAKLDTTKSSHSYYVIEIVLLDSKGKLLASQTTSEDKLGYGFQSLMIASTLEKTIISNGTSSLFVNNDLSGSIDIWDNTIASSDNGTTSDIKATITSLSANETMIFAGTNNGIAFRYSLNKNNIGYYWVIRGMSYINNTIKVIAQDSFVYVTGTSNTSSYHSALKVLPNGDIYDSHIVARKV